MTNLKLIKSESFGGVQADIYSNDKDMYMTALQLGECLGYANPRESINKIVSRNEYLRDAEFSAEVALTSPRGDTQSTRVFTEDGIYEVTMLSRTDKAKEFRSWIRRILKGLRSGEMEVIAKPMTQAEILAMQANLLVSMEQRVNAIDEKAEKANDRLDDALDIFASPMGKSWRDDMNRKINQMCKLNGFNYQVFKGDLYKELESAARCDITARQRNLRDRLKRGGATYKERKAISKIDVIERDEKLKLIFDGIVRKYQAKYLS